jgi:hypothetical protein
MPEALASLISIKKCRESENARSLHVEEKFMVTNAAGEF